MKDIIRKIAIQNGVSEAEVENEMREAIRIAMKSTEPSAKEFWQQLAPDGKEPPLEVVIGAIAGKVRKTTYQN